LDDSLFISKVLLIDFSFFRQHSLYFIPLPQGQGALRLRLLLLIIFEDLELDSSSFDVLLSVLSVVFKLSSIE
jgi:hypothetical protein